MEASRLCAAADDGQILVADLVRAVVASREVQRLEPVGELTLEALQDAAKHAGDGASVTVRLGEADGRVQFSVADDGRGFDAASLTTGSGLQNMSDRIGALGGELRITSVPHRGTEVSGSVPAYGPKHFD